MSLFFVHKLPANDESNSHTRESAAAAACVVHASNSELFLTLNLQIRFVLEKLRAKRAECHLYGYSHNDNKCARFTRSVAQSFSLSRNFVMRAMIIGALSLPAAHSLNLSISGGAFAYHVC